MISYRRVRMGKGYVDLPLDLAKKIEENARELSRVARERDRAALEADCVREGYDPKTFPRTMSPEDALRIHFGRIRRVLGRAELERRYPCRTCALPFSESYKAECRVLRVLPCFIEKRWAGCLLWKAKPEAVAAPETRRPGGNL